MTDFDIPDTTYRLSDLEQAGVVPADRTADEETEGVRLIRYIARGTEYGRLPAWKKNITYLFKRYLREAGVELLSVAEKRTIGAWQGHDNEEWFITRPDDEVVLSIRRQIAEEVGVTGELARLEVWAKRRDEEITSFWSLWYQEKGKRGQSERTAIPRIQESTHDSILTGDTMTNRDTMS